MSRTLPQRTKGGNEISQAFNDGVVRIYTIAALTPDGGVPKAELQERLRLPYQERKLGIRRYYEAKQNQIQAERVLRIPAPGEDITSQDAARTEDGRLYRIDLVQRSTDTYPPTLDLTLAAYVPALGWDPAFGGGIK